MTENRSTFLVALGSNLENEGTTPLATMQTCLTEFRKEGFELSAISRFFATPCFPAGAGPDYVNAAVVLTGDLSASDALAALHRIEAHFRRTRTERWGMRTLDLDLLAVDQQVRPDRETFEYWQTLPAERQRKDSPDQLILPHPRIQDRAFVLVPLADVARDWVHPALGLSVGQMLATCPATDRAEVAAL
ncbi:2-amino-4-hydroxy-6-hydroxymethyldihydropteridine diphosphokinase [Tritonibacter scottomollicae]|uniref:2-amino-4-hydroxy-6-hydroxymethyldihydropteridine pyrophosphokinase n=1 Tax=Tritonibacter scottomollicae TaxID=483013 RepID=A0A2T1AEK9_TRISK|nr:2-amino-4-hydroxy-6-hydroxymethyldihydropteridine diphosphokinase [Tritonibacter scottomollicae]PRZ47011.1 2-amino-4-hydroxy-6-hydroxymethyldihydropteridine diphosphokinase [Tritonibacter scottomollicae]